MKRETAGSTTLYERQPQTAAVPASGFFVRRLRTWRSLIRKIWLRLLFGYLVIWLFGIWFLVTRMRRVSPTRRRRSPAPHPPSSRGRTPVPPLSLTPAMRPRSPPRRSGWSPPASANLPLSSQPPFAFRSWLSVTVNKTRRHTNCPYGNKKKLTVLTSYDV